MSGKMIFLNLPVEDLNRSKQFYEAIGWSINQDFTDENAVCVIVDDDIGLMLLRKDFYKTFTKRPLADTAATTGALYALSLESREAVDALTEAAVAAGGTEEVSERDRAQEAESGMHGRAFLDPDGHQWEPFYMDYTGTA